MEGKGQHAVIRAGSLSIDCTSAWIIQMEISRSMEPNHDLIESIPLCLPPTPSRGWRFPRSVFNASMVVSYDAYKDMFTSDMLCSRLTGSLERPENGLPFKGSSVEHDRRLRSEPRVVPPAPA